jgi:N-acetylglutamate synthase-like GNAT family acetyltransferase
MRYSLRKAKPDDRAFAETLHEHCYKDVVIHQFGSWNPELQKQFFEDKWHPDRYQIIIYRGKDIGVLAQEIKPDHIFLSEIQIDPSVQNQGIGTEILTSLCGEALSLELPVRLQVLRYSRAVKLYVRIGFHQCGQTETHLLFEKACKRSTWRHS